MKQCVLIKFVLAAVLLFCAPAHSRDEDGDKTLVVAAHNFIPTIYFEDENVGGLLPPLLAEVASRAGYEIQYRDVASTTRMLVALERGEADVGVGLFRTPEREAFALFTNQPMMETNINLYLGDKTGFDGKDLSGLAELRIAAVRDHTFGAKLDAQFSELGMTSGFVRIPDYWTGLRMLDNKRINGVLIESALEGASLFVNGECKVFDHQSVVLDRIPNFLGFSKQTMTTDVRDAFDKALIDMRADGSYEKILAEARENVLSKFCFFPAVN